MVVTYTGNQKIRFYAVPLSPWFFGGISHFWSLLIQLLYMLLSRELVPYHLLYSECKKVFVHFRRSDRLMYE